MSGRLERFIRDLAGKAERLEVPRAIEETFGKYRDDPVGFCRDALGVASATRRSDGEPYQFTVLADVARAPRVAVRSGHGVGKSAIDGWAGLWWLVTRPLSRVVVLAPEYARQIRAVLFSEMRKWARRSRLPLPVTVLANRVLIEGFGEEWSATGMSTAGDPDRIEGFHAEGGVLVIVDETKGVPQDAFDAVQGALSGLEDSRLLVTSVPGGAGAGPFWKACQDARRWRIHHVPATDSSLVSPEWISDRAADWGVGSPLYTCRVLGEFADAGEGVLFPLALLDAAMARVPMAADGTPTGLGVDVARSVAGDLNTVARAAGGRLEVLRTWRSPDLMETVERVVHVAAETGLRTIAVDVGGPGGGAADRLAELGYQVRAVHFGGAAEDPTRFRNLRAALFWGLREALERGTAALADDDELRADLSAIRYTFTPAGQIQIEAKDEVRARLGRSPDRADAVALAAWVADANATGGAGWLTFMEHFDCHGTPRHDRSCAVCYPASGGAAAARVVRVPGDPAAPATCPACGSGRWSGESGNVADTTTWWRCVQCGFRGRYTKPAEPSAAAAHLPALFSAPSPDPAAARQMTGNCSRCGTPMFTPPVGGRATCSACGLQP